MSVASDSTGTKLVAVINAIGGTTNGIYRYTDYGATWIKSTGTNAAPSATWISVASDSTGTKLVALTDTGMNVWRYTDPTSQTSSETPICIMQ